MWGEASGGGAFVPYTGCMTHIGFNTAISSDVQQIKQNCRVPDGTPLMQCLLPHPKYCLEIVSVN